MISLLLCLMLMAPDAPAKPKYKAGDILVLVKDGDVENYFAMVIGEPNGEYKKDLGFQYEYLRAGRLDVGLIWETTIEQFMKDNDSIYFPYRGNKSWKVLKKEQLDHTRKLMGIK
ncbi:MAG: hypothetical protein DWQ19_10980 [Crenarchaeota archaeon]|nr:MAG: hypothetical protein DWQ19_10980 [Thermoproteota archaeon]